MLAGLITSIIYYMCTGQVLVSFGIAIFAIIFVALIQFCYKKVIRKHWTNRNEWIAEYEHNSYAISSLDLQRTLSKDRRLSWASPQPRSEGNRYRIDLGEDRVISRIQFVERSSSNEFPYGWRLMFLNK